MRHSSGRRSCVTAPACAACSAVSASAGRFQHGERLPTQVRQVRNALLTGNVRSGREQLLGDGEHTVRFPLGQGELRTPIPDQALRLRLGRGIRSERGSEKRFGPREILESNIYRGQER